MKAIKFNGKIHIVPNIPKFLFVPDDTSMELYIVHTNPYALIWICQAMPAKLFIIEGEQSETILKEAAEFYRTKSVDNLPKN